MEGLSILARLARPFMCWRQAQEFIIMDLEAMIQVTLGLQNGAFDTGGRCSTITRIGHRAIASAVLRLPGMASSLPLISWESRLSGTMMRSSTIKTVIRKLSKS